MLPASSLLSEGSVLNALDDAWDANITDVHGIDARKVGLRRRAGKPASVVGKKMRA